MKKTLALFAILTLFSFSLYALESHSTLAASLGFGSEEGSDNGISASAHQGNFGFFMGTGIFPDESNIGFHYDMDWHLVNWASNSSGSAGSSSIAGKNSFSLAQQIGLGPSFKTENDDFLLQFSPELSIGLEMETGKIYKESYLYNGFLFGFGSDISFAFNPGNKYSFVAGSHLAYYPVYKPSLKINDTTYNLDLDNYSRFMMNIYLGIQILKYR